MPRRVLFTINDKGIRRKLFTVEERGNLDLTIVLKDNIFSGHGAKEENRIVEHRFSVHRSLQSPRVNAIKRTLTLKSGAVETTRNYTAALKKSDKFAVIFARRAAISHERYNVTSTAARIASLGNTDSTFFQPVFMVLVSNPSRRFRLGNRRDVNMIDARFTHFRITVLWQFLMPGCGNTGWTLTFQTFSDEELDAAGMERQSKARMALGETSEEALEIFEIAKTDLARQFKGLLLRDEDPDIQAMGRYPRNMYTRSGVPNAHEHLVELTMLGGWLAKHGVEFKR